MKTIRAFVLLACCLSSLALSAQQLTEQQLRQIVKDGQTLYLTELLTWESVDRLYRSGNMSEIRGYLGYFDGREYHTIYWNGAYNNLAIVFSCSSPNPEDTSTIRIQRTARALSAYEKMLYDIKLKATLYIKSDTATFKRPDGGRLALMFLDRGTEIEALVVTHSPHPNVIPLGNSYRMRFNRQADLLSTERIHEAYVEAPLDAEQEGAPNDAEGGTTTFQTVSTRYTPHIAATDICQLLLYTLEPEGRDHYVISDDFISIYYFDDNAAVVLPNEATKGRN